MDTKKTIKTTKIRMDREDFEQIQYEMKRDPLSSDQSENYLGAIALCLTEIVLQLMDLNEHLADKDKEGSE